MNPSANREHIISIQSHVLDGFCGNNIASFVLRRRGHAPKIFNTVQYYSKYKHLGVEMKQEEMKIILGALKEDLAAAGDYLWICDPVMGDNGKLYVDKDVVLAYKECIPFVDIMTPNQFELELLCDRKIKNESDVITCVRFLLNRGVKLIVVTSVQYLFDKDHLYLYVAYQNSQGELVAYKYKIFRFDFDVCGSGDLFAALLLSFLIRHRGNVLLIVSKVLNIVHNVIKNSLSSGELDIIENQDIIASDGLCGSFIKAEPVCATHPTT
ncbi:Pyridoxal kinase [Plasmodium cynomolgi strain B]|uniref:pyridoxal kinase n=1 Tax=Plasmodium cynomolgi (strain B) TaxID=1120755 RepID=K6UDY1_PLACD|nr:Pyridoxal kinase [Plasmodium cynomolgi strain B]GAB67391.1 Pyridoxal kinase [Plasmodium cynomolgi strain B]